MGNYIHLLCFQTAIDLQKHLETKAASLEKRGAKLQPHVVVLASDNLREVDTAACYAVVHSSVYYETASVVAGVDTCIKAAFVMGLGYPAAAHSAWTLLQRAIHEVETAYDRVPSKALELISDIQMP